MDRALQNRIESLFIEKPVLSGSEIMDNHIVSKKRVADHGEVYTRKREVNAMLDLVKQETDRIDSRFLEPTCGTGNFLTEILVRKLRIVEKRYKKSQLEYELKRRVRRHILSSELCKIKRKQKTLSHIFLQGFLGLWYY